MNAMDKLFKLLLAAAAALFFTGCYSDYLNPGPARVYTRADFEAKGLEYISVGELKARFRAENAGMNDGAVASWTVDEPLFTSGKVISTDRFGNVYKSVYLYDEASESAIELKLNTGNYLFHPVGQIVYVDLEGLVLGNYRGMVSIGTTSYNASYSNDNIESKIMQDEHIFSGEQQPMLKSDTLVVTRDNYRTVLSDDDLGRLVRFEGVESRFGTAPWGYKNTFPNYFANSVSYDVNSPRVGGYRPVGYLGDDAHVARYECRHVFLRLGLVHLRCAGRRYRHECRPGQLCGAYERLQPVPRQQNPRIRFGR